MIELVSLAKAKIGINNKSYNVTIALICLQIMFKR